MGIGPSAAVRNLVLDLGKVAEGFRFLLFRLFKSLRVCELGHSTDPSDSLRLGKLVAGYRL